MLLAKLLFMKLDSILNPMLTKITAKKVKEQVTLLLFLGVALVALYMVFCVWEYYWGDKIIMLKVYTPQIREQMYHNVQFSFGNFITGREGTLYYKASSFIDFIVLYKVGGMDVIDYVFVLVITILVYNSFKSVSENKSFSEKMVRTLLLIGLLTVFICLFKMFYSMFEDYYLPHKTNHMFQVVSEHDYTSICLFQQEYSSSSIFLNKESDYKKNRN